MTAMRQSSHIHFTCKKPPPCKPLITNLKMSNSNSSPWSCCRLCCDGCRCWRSVEQEQQQFYLWQKWEGAEDWAVLTVAYAFIFIPPPVIMHTCALSCTDVNTSVEYLALLLMNYWGLGVGLEATLRSFVLQSQYASTHPHLPSPPTLTNTLRGVRGVDSCSMLTALLCSSIMEKLTQWYTARKQVIKPATDLWLVQCIYSMS